MLVRPRRADTTVSKAVGFAVPSRQGSGNARRLALALAVATGAANAAATPAYSFDAPRFANELDEFVVRRAADLREIAHDEDLLFSEGSLGFLRRFMTAHGSDCRKPAIFLMDDGSLRAVWRTQRQEQIGLAFRESGVVQFVIFAAEKSGAMNRATGEVKFANVMRQVHASEAGHILRA